MNACNVFMQPLLLFLASNEVTHTHDKGLCERAVLSAILLVNLVSSAFFLTEGFPHRGWQQIIPFLNQPYIRKQRCLKFVQEKGKVM